MIGLFKQQDLIPKNRLYTTSGYSRTCLVRERFISRDPRGFASFEYNLYKSYFVPNDLDPLGAFSISIPPFSFDISLSSKKTNVKRRRCCKDTKKKVCEKGKKHVVKGSISASFTAFSVKGGIKNIVEAGIDVKPGSISPVAYTLAGTVWEDKCSMPVSYQFASDSEGGQKYTPSIGVSIDGYLKAAVKGVAIQGTISGSATIKPVCFMYMERSLRHANPTGMKIVTDCCVSASIEAEISGQFSVGNKGKKSFSQKIQLLNMKSKCKREERLIR